MMKCIKKAISFVLLATLLFSTVSCGLVYIPNDEEKAFESVLPKLFEALDSGDNVAIYELFSPAVREQSDNLQEQIAALISVYSGPTDEFDLEDVPMHGREHIGDPGNWASADATIPVRSGDNYYYFGIDLMFEHYDEKQVGITQLEFYTADEMCAFRESNDQWIERKGLYLHAEKNLGCEIRTIDGYPNRYTPTTHTINVEEVKEFLKSSSSFSEFVERFGEANAKSSVVDYYYYELPKENGEPRYLNVSEDDEVIRSITIVDDFKFIEMVWEKE
ncbi:MAG: DUF5104 domain-containing protein [Clostridia bacterium]|nr:DUF5104 domain-containing protein [Clostridia bacterium]